ncbi:protein phosphatase 1 regulatory subunit 3D isoform X2 [Salmo trutta]|uniref:Protein phosphatase 1 regulatory subunit 3D n=2 Tax=Salmo trutta TaxID=8032 RepID=A0A674CHN1_SALTR|nr:protein phosphatase 1 regulatory subunit 3D-like isoform X2 [Salmo trutta]XP_029548592.1 protein phosphatase 1 regulatory subunit 3D-like isoform X2 [Salmo trutta]
MVFGPVCLKDTVTSPVSMMSSMASVGRPKAVSHGVVGKEKDRTWFCGNDRLKTVSPCVKGKPRAVSPGMIGEQRAVSPCVKGKPRAVSPGMIGEQRAVSPAVVGRDKAWSPGVLQNTSNYSSVTPCQTTTKTLRVTDILDSKPEPTKAPVKIRPPSPRPPSPKEPIFSRNLSSDPPVQPIIRRRTQSLPSVRERIRDRQVRFVDSLGLELEEIKVFSNGEEPRIPAHVFSRLLMSAEMNSGRSLELSLPYFKPCFPENMGSQPGFVQRLVGQVVSLDQVLCSELGIIGTVQVLNLAFDKEVTIHYSFTNWRSSAETRACWVATLHRDQMEGPESDLFRFRLPVPPFILLPGAQLEFAVCYRVMGAVYWDNNDGKNYKLSCHSYTLTVPRECEASMVHYT